MTPQEIEQMKADMEAEILRLRDALERIVRGQYDGLEVRNYSAADCVQIARCALNGGAS